MPLYDRIGNSYDETRRADPYIASRLLDHLGLRGRGGGGRYLDVSCGTGNYAVAVAAAAAGGRWIGLDISARMLRAAAAKQSSVAWVQGSVDRLPFAGGAFDGAICVLALHHYPSLERALAEIRRVLAPGARLVAFTSTSEQMQGYWLNEYFPEAMRRSIEQMPSHGALRRALDAAGLEPVGEEPYFVRPDLVDRFLYSGKHRPEHYLSEHFRHGSSTFASLADPAEVARGTARLEADIADGRISGVLSRYENRAGDYLFLVARSPSGGS